MQVHPLGKEGPLEKEMATHSSVLTRKIPWTEAPHGLQSMGSQRGRHNLATKPQQTLMTMTVFYCSVCMSILGQRFCFIHTGDVSNTEYTYIKLQYFGHLMQRTDSFEKTLMLGKIQGRRRRGWQKDEMVGWHYWLDGHEFEQTLGIGDGQGSLVVLQSIWFQSQTWLSNWTDWFYIYIYYIFIWIIYLFIFIQIYILLIIF